MMAFTLSASDATSAMATVVSTSNGRLAGRPNESASAPRVVCTLPSMVWRLSCAWLAAVRAWSTSAMVASPTRRRSSAATRLVFASSTVVLWARSKARFARYWK
jgi:hypothetical protein